MTSSLADYDLIGDRIRLARQGDHRPALIVEGSTDRTFLYRLWSEDVTYYVAGNRDAVLREAAEVRRLQLDRVACVVDRDFDDAVAGAEADGLPVIAYDNADLEAMLWSSKSLESLLDELASSSKLATFGGVSAVRSRTVEILRPVSRLRRASFQAGWHIRFDALDLASKIDRRRLTIRLEPLCDAIRNAHPNLDRNELLHCASDETTDIRCPTTGAELVRGRDALAVLGVALRSLIGNRDHLASTVAALEEALRLTARSDYLVDTLWYDSVLRLLEVGTAL